MTIMRGFAGVHDAYARGPLTIGPAAFASTAQTLDSTGKLIVKGPAAFASTVQAMDAAGKANINGTSAFSSSAQVFCAYGWSHLQTACIPADSVQQSDINALTELTTGSADLYVLCEKVGTHTVGLVPVSALVPLYGGIGGMIIEEETGVTCNVDEDRRGRRFVVS